MNGKRRLLGSFNHGSMASAYGQAYGGQRHCASGRQRPVPATAGSACSMGRFSVAGADEAAGEDCHL